MRIRLPLAPCPACLVCQAKLLLMRAMAWDEETAYRAIIHTAMSWKMTKGKLARILTANGRKRRRLIREQDFRRLLVELRDGGQRANR